MLRARSLQIIFHEISHILAPFAPIRKYYRMRFPVLLPLFSPRRKKENIWAKIKYQLVPEYVPFY